MSGHLDDTTVDHLCQIVRDHLPDDFRYRIAEQIGQGGMGTVYRADDLALNRQVAMKVLRDGCAASEFTDRLIREARVIARLEHPGIVPVHDAGRLPDGRVYYTMKLVKGRRLDEFADSPASMFERLRVFERVCETVAFAHSQRVIHRDLKPQNVMVGEFGEVLVLDWGVAKVAPERSGNNSAENCPASVDAKSDARQTAHGTILGTPAYMPPEQARGDVERIDERSDVYALGGLLYFMLTGMPPRTAPGHVPEQVVLVPPRQLNRDIPRRLESICTKALSSEPAQRYATATELVSDIVRFLNGQSVHAHREGLLERLARVGWWYRVPILIVGAYLIMRTILIVWQRR